MKKLVVDKVATLLFASSLFLSSQAVQAYKAQELIEKADGMMEVMDKLAADKKQGNSVVESFTLLKNIANDIDGNAIKKPLFWYIELLENSPEKALDAREFMKARQEFRNKHREEFRSYSRLDSSASQWGDTLGQILIQFYRKHLGDKDQSEKTLKGLLLYYPRLSLNLEKLS